MKPIEIPVTCACYNYSCIRETHVSSLELTWNRYYSYWGERLIREELDYRSLDVKTTLEFQLSFFFFLIIFVIGVLEWRKVLNKAITELRLAFRSSDFWFRVFFPSYSTCAWTITAGFAQV